MAIEYGTEYVVTIPALSENANIVQAFQQYHDDIQGFFIAKDSEISAKQNAISGAATTVVSNNLTASRSLVSDSSGKISASTVTSAELSQLSGVTGKTGSGNVVLSISPTIASPTISGTVPEISIANTLKILSSQSASLASTDHPLQIGAASAINLAIDNNKIIARNNGSSSTLGLNTSGGNVSIGSSSAVSVDGTLTVNNGIYGKRVQPIVTRTTSGTITLSTSQAGNILRTTHSSGTVTYTVGDSTLAQGESVDILRGGNGEVAVAYSGSGLLVSELNRRRLAVAYSGATIVCTSDSPKIYHLVGSLKT